jgi:electron transport complex protein RnfB
MRCGYPDCAAYAQAIADQQADINQCPPGGAEGIARLAAITGRPVKDLSPEHGVEGPRALAVIDETWCIGCTLCIKACPTDAIVGMSKKMHTVIEPHCTGCELCIPVCPVDCISLENVTAQDTGWAAWSAVQAEQARGRYQLHRERLPLETPTELDETNDSAAIEEGQTTGTAAKTAAGPTTDPQATDASSAQTARQATIATALERARQRRAAQPPPGR